MCGICGIIGGGDEAALARMMDRLEHRGPDEAGRHVEPGLLLGMRRLNVIDPAGGHQPISNETGTVWVIMNGEIYNYRELRRELMDKGHRFTTHCDTEVLVHLYEEEGEAGVRRLRGMFAYALWDRARRRVLLVRDRLGIKPLYYAVLPPAAGEAPRLVFASELPALLEALPGAALQPAAIARYLNWLYVPGPETLYDGVRQLPPGEWLSIEGGKIDGGRYYDPAPPPSSPAQSEEERKERFLGLLKETVRAHLVSDVPLGLFLSGGLDSGAILAMMRAVTNGPIRTFSIGYDHPADRSYNELEAARLMAGHFGAEHTEERLRPDVVMLLPRIVAAMGEPFADSSAIPTYLVSQVARRQVTVALSGIGGDEAFGGYPRYLGVRAAARYARLPMALRRGMSRWLVPHLPERAGGRDYTGRLRRFLQHGALDLAVQYRHWVTFLPAEWSGAALTPDFTAAIEAQARAHQALFEKWPRADPSDQAMGLDLQTYLPDDLLRMGDRLSMAHSLELRVPFCDHELLAFACGLPAPVRFAGWTLKGFMRRALRGVLPPPILHGPKLGFSLPLARWLREDLREMLHDLLSESAVQRRGYVRPAYVAWLLAEHESGRRNFADQLFALLVLELWHQTAVRS